MAYLRAHQSRKREGRPSTREASSLERKREREMCVCIQRKKKVPRCRERIIPEHSEGGRLEREDKRWRERERKRIRRQRAMERER